MTAQTFPRPLLVHVGYHKTATTWLQNDIFTPQNGYRQILSHSEIFSRIIEPHGLDFDPAPLATEIAARRAADPGATEVDVISLESLTGLPFEDGRESDVYARRLQALAPDAKILLSIREQYAILASVYMQYLKRAGTESPQQFFAEPPFKGYFHFTARNFLYHRLIGLYQELFGAANVLALPLEEITADQGQALNRLAGFSGNAGLVARIESDGWNAVRERGVSHPQYVVPLLRRINHFRSGERNLNPVLNLDGSRGFLYRGVGWLGQHLPVSERVRRSRPVTDYARQRFPGYFAESNRSLEAMLYHKVDLSRYDGIAAAPPAAAVADAGAPAARMPAA